MVWVCLQISGRALIGATIKVFWPAENKWYTGFVRAYIAQNHKHTVHYDDGDWRHEAIPLPTPLLLPVPLPLPLPIPLPIPPLLPV